MFGSRQLWHMDSSQIHTDRNEGLCASQVNMELLGEPEAPEEISVAGLLGYFGTRYELEARQLVISVDGEADRSPGNRLILTVAEVTGVIPRPLKLGPE